MRVEMYIGKASQTWVLTTVDIPDCTAAQDIEQVAMDTLRPQIAHLPDVAFYGVSCIEQVEDHE